MFLIWWRRFGGVGKGCAAAVSSRWQCCPVAQHEEESLEVLSPAKHALHYVSAAETLTAGAYIVLPKLRLVLLRQYSMQKLGGDRRFGVFLNRY